METFPDLGSLTDTELKDLIKELTDEETEVSYQRRILHGKIDILRAELVNRLRRKDESGELVISGADVQQLTDILTGNYPPTRRAARRSRLRARHVAQHCPECGFANADGANYCQRCGAFMGGSESAAGDSTATYRIGDTGEFEEVPIEAVTAHGAALVIRAGGGRAGETLRARSSRG